jgi:hypothetical protein
MASPVCGRRESSNIGNKCSAPNQPQHRAEQEAQQQAGHEREIEGPAFALDHDISGKPPEPELAQTRRENAEQENREPKNDQEARHAGSSVGR